MQHLKIRTNGSDPVFFPWERQALKKGFQKVQNPLMKIETEPSWEPVQWGLLLRLNPVSGKGEWKDSVKFLEPIWPTRLFILTALM